MPSSRKKSKKKSRKGSVQYTTKTCRKKQKTPKKRASGFSIGTVAYGCNKGGLYEVVSRKRDGKRLKSWKKVSSNKSGKKPLRFVTR